MATSPIYNWPEPDNTDLVKNGALAIRTLGNAIDTTMATMVPKTIVDAKGDLIAGTAADTAARLAVGNNGETIVADSSTSTGLRYTAGTVQANPVLNSAFQVWQRGTSLAFTGGAINYVADRWQAWATAAGTSISVSRQNTSDTTNLPFIQYCTRFQRVAANASTSPLIYQTSLESISSIPFAGKTVTFSFYARKGADYTASDLLVARVIQGTGTDQNATGFTSSSNVVSLNSTLTSTWQRFTVTGTVNTTSTQLGVQFLYTPTGTASTNDYYEVTGVQIDVGSVALPFRTNGATIQGELAACQRYYWRQTGESPYSVYAMGANTSTTVCNLFVQFPQIMRTSPSAVEYSTLALQDTNFAAVLAVTALGIDSQTQSTKGICINATVASGLTQFRTSRIEANNSTSAYIGFSAEL